MAPHWQDFTALCARVRAGDDPVDRATLEAVLLELADLQSEWFVTGFGLRDLPGGLYFDVHRHPAPQRRTPQPRKGGQPGRGRCSP